MIVKFSNFLNEKKNDIEFNKIEKDIHSNKTLDYMLTKYDCINILEVALENNVEESYPKLYNELKGYFEDFDTPETTSKLNDALNSSLYKAFDFIIRLCALDDVARYIIWGNASWNLLEYIIDEWYKNKCIDFMIEYSLGFDDEEDMCNGIQEVMMKQVIKKGAKLTDELVVSIDNDIEKAEFVNDSDSSEWYPTIFKIIMQIAKGDPNKILNMVKCSYPVINKIATKEFLDEFGYLFEINQYNHDN